MKVLVLGGSGATGKQVVMQLLKRKIQTRIVIRESASIPDEITGNNLIEIIRGNIYEFDERKNKDLIKDCGAVICCLGHNISLKGIFGKPRLLLYQSLKNICEAIARKPEGKTKVILMSTVANENKDINENRSPAERIILSLLKILLPPHRDNVLAAGYLVGSIGKNNEKIEWTAVRPDSLIDNADVTAYEISESIKRSPLFNPGKTSRINVASFMVELLTNEELWKEWKGKMPVIYNKE